MRLGHKLANIFCKDIRKKNKQVFLWYCLSNYQE